MHPILFQLGETTIYTHGLLAVLGIILGAILTYYLARRKDLSNPYFFDLVIFTTLLGIIGARITYYILYHDQFTTSGQIFFLWQGGLVSYGGFVLGGITFALISRAQRQPVLKWFDFISTGFFLGLLVGRIGDLLAGEYAGVPIIGSKFLGYFSVVPVPLYEAVLCLLIFIFSLFAFLRLYDRLKTGMVFLSSILIYSAGRFIIDFWRLDKDWFWHISAGQVFSLLIFVCALLGTIFLLTRKEETIL